MSPSRLFPCTVLTVPLVAFLLLLALPAGAQHVALPAPHVLEAADYEAMYKVPRPPLGKNTAASAEIIVRYVDFPPEARAAFQFAVDIWETHIRSDVPLYMVAQWAELDERTLGSAGPATFFADDTFLPRDDAWYALPLVHALAGERLVEPDTDGTCYGGFLPAVEGECPDMFATFNSNLDIDNDGDIDWSFAPDPEPASIRGEYHLATVVLHEIAHGLGFLDSFDLDDGDDERDECPNGEVGTGCWGFRSTTGLTFPTVFDLFVEDASERLLIDTQVYPNPSEALGDVLQSENVFFAGPLVSRTNVDVPADLYAPRNFEPGSSTAHFDEQVFNNTPNALMTPQLARSEVILSPGPLTCALFGDLGWPLGPDCQAFIDPGLLAFEVDVDGGGPATVLWQVAEDAGFDRFVLARSEIPRCGYTGCVEEEDEVRFVPVETIELEPGETVYSRQVEAGPLPGRYAVRLQLCRDGCDDLDGDEIVVNGAIDRVETGEVDFQVEETMVTTVYPNPFVQRAQLSLVLEGSRETCRGEPGQQVEVTVYNSLGRHVARLFDGCVLEGRPVHIDFPADELAAGVYFIRVDGERFGETLEAVKVGGPGS